MRNQLAILDHNFHLDRKVNVNNDGMQQIGVWKSRRTKEWVAYTRLESKSYSYIPGTMELIFADIICYNTMFYIVFL